jgi:pimeloyl-ACP methyl ester carboxylesterase
VKQIEQHQLEIKGYKDKTITMDITLPVSKTKTPVIVFCHGFKGFKDWGHFNWVANTSAKEGLAFLKFNFSHNGISASSTSELSDMESFSENNYSIELFDLGKVIDFIDEQYETYNLNRNEIYLVGHSRGGGIAMLKASEDRRVKKLVLWASVSEFDSFFRPETIAEWEKNGVVYAPNKRTGQQLPLKKQLHDDYISNKSLLDVQKASKLLAIPLLIIHGDQDETVTMSHAESLYETVQHSILIKVEGANHTFSAKHPFNAEEDVTDMLEELVENTVEFLKD